MASKFPRSLQQLSPGLQPSLVGPQLSRSYATKCLHTWNANSSFESFEAIVGAKFVHNIISVSYGKKLACVRILALLQTLHVLIRPFAS